MNNARQALLAHLRALESRGQKISEGRNKRRRDFAWSHREDPIIAWGRCGLVWFRQKSFCGLARARAPSSGQTKKIYSLFYFHQPIYGPFLYDSPSSGGLFFGVSPSQPFFPISRGEWPNLPEPKQTRSVYPSNRRACPPRPPETHARRSPVSAGLLFMSRHSWRPRPAVWCWPIFKSTRNNIAVRKLVS